MPFIAVHGVCLRYRLEGKPGGPLLVFSNSLGPYLSMGGQVGIWLGANAPQRFARLVLCDTAAHIGNPEIWNARIAAIRAGGMPAIVSGTIERWFTQKFIAHSPDAIALVRRMILDTPPQGYIGCCEAI